ncbi:MAG: DUF2079 domain-containing protein [Patescibacteria group bacterium]|jgi:uncharacterized membrane protein
MLKFLKQYSYKILWLAIFIYSLFFSWLSLKKYYNFSYNIFDLTIFNQVFFNTSNGRLFAMTFNLNNYLADHFTPIIILLLPLYKLWPSPQILLIMQSIILALCAWPIYKIAKKVINNKLISLGIIFLWFINFLLHNANLFEFHFLSFAIFFIFWAFYFYYSHNYKLWLLFFVLALLVREDIGFILLGFSILAFLDKRSAKWLFTPILGILYFLGALQIIASFNLGDSNKFFLYYGWLGGDSLISILWIWLSHPLQFLGHLLSGHNIASLFIMAIALGFLPLLAPRYLWLLFFPLMQFALTAQGINSAVYSMHYATVFLPGLFIATIFAINKIVNKEKFIFSQTILTHKNIFISLFVFTVIYFSVFLSPIKNVLFYHYAAELRENRQYFIDQIPEEASLVVSASLAPALSNRINIYPLQYSYLGKTQFYLDDFKFPEVDYILIDTEDMLQILAYFEQVKNRHFDNIKVSDIFRNRLNDYVLIAAKNNLLLWQNKSLVKSEKELSIYSTSEKPQDFDNNDFVVSGKYFKQDNLNILEISYQKTQSDISNYLLRFYGDDYYIDIPLDYGVWLVFDWSEDNLINFYYYLSDDIKAYQLFSWQGEVKLSDIRDAKVDLILKKVSERINIKE